MSPELAFEFRLARDLHLTVAELRRRLSVAEFTEWIAYYRHEAAEQKRAEAEAQKQHAGRRRPR